MDSTIVITIISTVGVLGVPYLVGWWQYRKAKLELKKNKQVKEGKEVALSLSIESMRASVEVSALLYNLQTLGFGRVLILAFGNGGKIPKVGSDYYTSAIDTSTFSKEKEHQILERYNSVKVDSEYIDFCSKLAMHNDYRHHYKVPKREDVTNDKLTKLQGWYREENIQESFIFHIATDAQGGENERFKMYILSLAVYETQIWDESEINWSEVDRVVDRIRTIYKTYYST